MNRTIGDDIFGCVLLKTFLLFLVLNGEQMMQGTTHATLLRFQARQRGPQNRPRDTLALKSALQRFRFYDPPEWGLTDIADMAMIDGLKRFQSKNGLSADGVMKPGGPRNGSLKRPCRRNRPAFLEQHYDSALAQTSARTRPITRKTSAP
tara:strand:- start:67 stop:516 length:450 start_codon:yes stop_codon:yes gene_type:complete